MKSILILVTIIIFSFQAQCQQPKATLKTQSADTAYVWDLVTIPALNGSFTNPYSTNQAFLYTGMISFYPVGSGPIIRMWILRDFTNPASSAFGLWFHIQVHPFGSQVWSKFYNNIGGGGSFQVATVGPNKFTCEFEATLLCTSDTTTLHVKGAFENINF